MNLCEEVEDVLQSVKSIGKKLKRKVKLTQYLNQDNVKRPYTDMTLPPSQQVLEAGIYKIKSDMKGPYFEVHEVNTDELLRFKDERYDEVLNEINDFWTNERKEKFKNMGFTHKRGIILYGEAGVGKSCLMKLVMEQMIEQDDIVFIADSHSVYDLREGLKQFKEVEPDRNCVVILEDIDEAMQYNEKAFLNLFDGDEQINGVLYLATSNHIEKLSDRFKRPGRFDRLLKIHLPPREGRLAYLNAKLGCNEDEDIIGELADDTDGLSFGQLRELLVASYCLGQEKDKVLMRLKGNGGLEESYTEQELDSFLNYKFKSNHNLIESINRLIL